MKEYLINKRLQELCAKDGHLSNEDNVKLFEEYFQEKSKGVPLEDITARTLLILGNNKLISFVLKNQFNIFSEHKNLDEYSYGQIGLIKAIDTYKMDCQTRFNTYAYRVISNEINMYYRRVNNVKNTLQRNKISLDDYISDGEDSQKDMQISDVVGEDYDFVEDVLEKEELKRILKNISYLTREEALAIINYYGLIDNHPKNQDEIGQMLGFSQSYVSRFCNKAIIKLKVLTLDDSSLTKDETKLKLEILKNGFQNNLVYFESDKICYK